MSLHLNCNCLTKRTSKYYHLSQYCFRNINFFGTSTYQMYMDHSPHNLINTLENISRYSFKYYPNKKIRFGKITEWISFSSLIKLKKNKMKSVFTFDQAFSLSVYRKNTINTRFIFSSKIIFPKEYISKP